MIVMAVLKVVEALVQFIFGWFTIPSLSGAETVVDWVLTMLQNGMSFIQLLVDVPFWRSCLIVLLALVVADKLWLLLWWIIRKIPFVSIR